MKPMTQIPAISRFSSENVRLLSPKSANYRIWVHCLATVEHQRQIEQRLRQQVKHCAQLGNYSQAIALLTRLIRRHPDSAREYNNRGLMYFYNQQTDQALQDYDLAIALDPLLDSAYNNRANCYGRLGQRFAALQDYQKALDLNPWNIRALVNLGITYRELEDYDGAIELLETALFLGKGYKARIYGERGYTYYLRGDWNCAIADYQRALNCTHDLAYRDLLQQRLEQLLGNQS